MHHTFAYRAADMRREALLEEAAAFRRTSPQGDVTKTRRRMALRHALSPLADVLTCLIRAFTPTLHSLDVNRHAGRPLSSNLPR